ncbi:MAG TPA: FIST N-terminal domain-containing protein [Abditibacteriaceae bacterium]|jgi:hypothetical protein
MSTKVGIGWSENHDSFQAGREAATAALENAALSKSDLLLVFSTSKHDPVALHQGLREVVGNTPRIIGGYGIGVLTNRELGYDGYQVGVAALASSAQIDLFLEQGLPDNEFAVGQALGRQIATQDYNGDPNIILMYDSMNLTTAQPKMNMATPLIQGLKESFPVWPPCAGIGLTGDTPSVPVVQWFDDEITGQCAQALVFSGGLRMDTVVMHGCKPAGSYHTITKSDGPVVLEIDNRPAVEVIAELLGPDSGYSWEDYRFFVTLGVNKGDKFGPFREEDYANRLCCGVDKERGGLVMFEPDLTPGTEVQLMRRSVDFGYIGQRTNDLLKQLGGRKPVFALYIDCAGRASAYCGSEGEEASEVQRAIGDIPLLGLYCGVEVARVGRDLQPLDWSGVLCVWSEA